MFILAEMETTKTLTRERFGISMKYVFVAFIFEML